MKPEDTAGEAVATVRKPYQVSVLVISESNGVINQEIIGREGAFDEKELVKKHFAIGSAVAEAFRGACYGLAKEAGYVD